jgi:hypothetical protein
MGFEGVSEEEGVSPLVFRRGKEIPDDRIISMTMVEPS